MKTPSPKYMKEEMLISSEHGSSTKASAMQVEEEGLKDCEITERWQTLSAIIRTDYDKLYHLMKQMDSNDSLRLEIL